MCDVCGAGDRLGLGTCASCATPGADALLFLEPSKRRADRQVLEAWLVGALGGAVRRSEVREAAEGLRPVVTLPAGAAGKAAGAWSLRGVGATSIPRHAAWRRVPPGFAALAGMSGGVGLFVGLTGTAVMLFLAPLFTALLVAAALHQLRLPVWRPQASPVLGLSEGLELEVRSILARLEEGRARHKLKDFVALTLALRDQEKLPLDDELAGASEELLKLACRAVVDLDQLDRSLQVLESDPRAPEGGGGELELGAATSEAARVRDALASRLDEALATLVRAQTAHADSAAQLLGAAERLADETARRSRTVSEVWPRTG